MDAMKEGYRKCHLAMWRDLGKILFLKHNLFCHVLLDNFNFLPTQTNSQCHNIHTCLNMHITKIFFSLDNWPPTSAGLPSTAGTTASIAIIRKTKLFVAHCGDSGITWGVEVPSTHGTKLVADMLTTDHKPELEPEYSRIVASGGKVAKKGEVNRVVWYRPKTKQPGPIRRNTEIEEIPFLAVARSLGDLWSYNYFTNKFVVSPDPDVDVYQLDPHQHKCLILATDGLWNVMDHQEAVSLFHQAEQHNTQYGGRGWKNPSRYLVQNALQMCRNKRMRADNVTVICVALDPDRTHNEQIPHQAIYDYNEHEGYSLDYLDPYMRYPYMFQLPPFENVANHYGNQQAHEAYPNLPPSPSVTYCHNSPNMQPSAFVNACCHQNYRFVLADNGEVINSHYNIEHHRQEYQEMMDRPLATLHYAYQPIPAPPQAPQSFFMRAMNRPVEKVLQTYYVPPTEEEFAQIHNDIDGYRQPEACLDDVNDESFDELCPLLTPQNSTVELERADTPIMNESDGDEMEWSVLEEENRINESELDESVQINEISSSSIEKAAFGDNELEKSVTSVRRHKKSSSCIEKNVSADDELDTTIAPTRKRKSTVARSERTRYHQTRQKDRKTRSNRVFGIENASSPVRATKRTLTRTKKPKPFKVRVPIDPPRSRNTNKENNVEPSTSDRRELRSKPKNDNLKPAKKPKTVVLPKKVVKTMNAIRDIDRQMLEMTRMRGSRRVK